MPDEEAVEDAPQTVSQDEMEGFEVIEPEVVESPLLPERTSEGRGQLARLDPFRRYLVEIRNYRNLEPEEEKALVAKYRDGDQGAAYHLITANLKLVVKIAMMYNRVYTNAMDLIQEGNIGLLEAVKRFDPDKGARLPTYASWWIKAYIIKFLLDNFRIVRVGTTNERRKLLFNLRKEKEKLRLQGIEPTHERIAKKLNVSVEDVREIEQNIEGGDVSLDSPLPGDTSSSYGDLLEAAEDKVEERLARGELQALFNENIREFAKELSERDQMILYKRLISEDPWTLQQIADEFGVTREAIRLSEKSLIKRIKIHMQSAFAGVTKLEFSLLE